MAQTATVTSVEVKRRARRDQRLALARRLASGALYYVLLLGLAAMFTAPLVWMMSASFKPEGYIFEYPPRLIAERIQWWNYTDAWVQFPLWVALKNTLTITFGVMVGRLLSASLTAYAFARVRF